MNVSEALKNKIAYLFYYEWIEAINTLPLDQRFNMVEKLCEYAQTGNEPDMTPQQQGLFWFMKKRIDNNTQSYIETTQRRSNAGKLGAEKRWGMANNGNAIDSQANNGNAINAITNDGNAKKSMANDGKRWQDKDKDIDIDIVKDKDIKEKKENNLKENKENTPSKRFVKPTLEAVRQYVAQQGYGIDPEAFIDYYESKGWKVGTSPMKDWKAAVRTWARNNKQQQPANPEPKQEKEEYWPEHVSREEYAGLMRFIDGKFNLCPKDYAEIKIKCGYVKEAIVYCIKYLKSLNRPIFFPVEEIYDLQQYDNKLNDMILLGMQAREQQKQQKEAV